MPTPAQIITAVSALMNDSAQSRYNNTTCLPYFNLALDILQEVFELNGIPITNEHTPGVIAIPAGVFNIGVATTPALPFDLIEIQQLWESPSGLNQWSPMTKREFIPHYLENGVPTSIFGIWSWEGGFIRLIAANADIDLKLDYTSNMFNTPIDISAINTNLAFTNIKTYLEFETAALCAMFIAENTERFMSLNNFAADALSRALGIPIKGMQSILTRRMPFRASYKRRGTRF